MKKWAYPLLIAFVAFYIFSSPGRAGTQGRAFVIWLGDLAGATGEFLDGLFDEDIVIENNDNLQPGGGTGTGTGAADTSRTQGVDPGTGADTTTGGGGVDNGASTNDGGGDRFETLAPLTS